MQIGVVGLGRMGANMTRRLLIEGHRAVVYDHNQDKAQALVIEGATPTESLVEIVAALETPRAVWIMLPAGEPTEKTVSHLAELMAPGDTIIDGGNSFYKDSMRRAASLKGKGIQYVDVGTSGGIWGAERGYCLMIGGDRVSVERLDPIFSSLAPGAGAIARTSGREEKTGWAERGYIHAGPSGAGHFVKMVHNGIEYGLMQAYAEGFDILKNANSLELPPQQRLELNLADVAEVWRRGSVISSWLLDLIASALAREEDLASFEGHVQDSGEGRWTIEAALEEAVPATVLSAAVFARFRSRQEHSFADKLLSAMRRGFGGHQEPKER